MGVNINRVISFTFGLGSALAAIGGIFYAMRSPGIDPLMGMKPGLYAFVAAVIGGIGNLPGAALGGLLLGMLETFAGGIPGVSNYRDGIAFAILILILMFNTRGIAGPSAAGKSLMNNAAKRWLLAGVALAFVASYFSGHFNRYYLGVAIDVGISVIMAVSLKPHQWAHGPIQPGACGIHGGGRIHGGTVDFEFFAERSNGQSAGNSAVRGGYVARRDNRRHHGPRRGIALVATARRLPRDCLLSDLGRLSASYFKPPKRSAPPPDSPESRNRQTLFWAMSLAAVTIYVVACLVNSTYGRGFPLRPRRRSRRRRHGNQSYAL
jgi:ABC-type branched-subunit amino acid transport system permease subunit